MGYRGEILVKFKPSIVVTSDKGPVIETVWDDSTMDIGLTDDFIHYSIGDRIAQIMIVPYPKVNFIEVNELSETSRGTGGFGSTGN